MVQKGDMMSVEDVTEILAIPLIGVIPDDEQIVIATNQGNPSSARTVCPDRLMTGSAGGFWVKNFPSPISAARTDFSCGFAGCSGKIGGRGR